MAIRCDITRLNKLVTPESIGLPMKKNSGLFDLKTHHTDQLRQGIIHLSNNAEGKAKKKAELHLDTLVNMYVTLHGAENLCQIQKAPIDLKKAAKICRQISERDARRMRRATAVHRENRKKIPQEEKSATKKIFFE